MRHFTRPLCHCSPPPGTSRNSLANACPQSRAPLPEPLSPPCPEHSRRLAALLLPGCGDSTDRDATPKTFLPYVRRFSRQASENERAGKSRDPPSRRYRDALAAVPAMRGQAAAKPAHIGQKVRRGRRRVPETAHLMRLGPGRCRRGGAKPLVGGQLGELCGVFPPDFPLHEGSGRSLRTKPQVNLKQTGLSWEMAAHNSIK